MARFSYETVPAFEAPSIFAVLMSRPVYACGHFIQDEPYVKLMLSYVPPLMAIDRGDLKGLLHYVNRQVTRQACNYLCAEELDRLARKADAAAKRAAKKLADPAVVAEKKAKKAAIRENPYANLPTIIDVLGTQDYGEYGAALCPHCGAEGRYVKTVACDDGTERGVMAGCFKKFRQHPVVAKIAYYQDKWEAYAKKGWALSRFDQQISDAIQAMRAGTTSADDVIMVIRQVAAAREQYQRRRLGFR